MADPVSENEPNFGATLAAHERQERIHTHKIAALLVVILMPAGVVLDYFVYPHELVLFLILRLICSVLAGGIWFLQRTEFGCNYYRLVGVAIPLLPAFFISIMIYLTDGPTSPYYAGLNLIVLAISVVVRWNAAESFAAIMGVLLMYLAACLLGGTREQFPIIFNNYYFLILTGIIVIVGNHFFTRLRLREFASGYELDQNRSVLQEINQKLSAQNIALAKANQEIRAAEMQLVQSEKLASLGRFSAGLMHDVLNPLNYARTGTFTLRRKCRNLPPELKAEFEAILTDVDDGLKRVDNLVSDLRTFTHPGGQAAEDSDVAEVLNMALRFVSSELKDKNVRVETEVAPGQKAWISRNHMILVLVNLVENAIDALEEKKFRAGEVPLIRITGETRNGRSLLHVRDNGPGIEPQHLSKVFDPFYTTKDVGKGTGLGLSICFGIMRGYSGSIAVASEPGKFCEFNLELPCSHADVTVAEHAD